MQQPLPDGTRLNQYTIIKLLGRGGFGVTYQAREDITERLVAIKELFPDGLIRADIGNNNIALIGGDADDWTEADFEKLKAAFVQEAQILRGIQHPQIVPGLTFFEANNTHYLVMEFIEGRTLLAHSNAYGPLPWQEAVALIQQVAIPVGYLHSQGIYHRDLNPRNVLLRTEANGTLLPIVIDFGLARVGVTKTKGTKAFVYEGYAPLEQYVELPGVAREFGAYSDVYSLAALLFRLLTKEDPKGADIRALGGELPTPHSLLPTVPPWLSDAVMAGMEIKASYRTQSIAAFIRRLEPPTLKPVEPIQIHPEPPPLPPRSRRALLMSAGTLGVSALYYTLTRLYKPKSVPTPEQKPTIIAKHFSAGMPFTAMTVSQSRKLPIKHLPPKTLVEYKAQMVSIPGGIFQMGNNKAKKYDGPVHSVTLSSFKMGRTPVTVGMWQEFCTTVGRSMPTVPLWGWQEDHPIVNISWEDCQMYADWAGLALPTEAQWEYAARGGSAKRRAYPWGDAFDDTKLWCSVTTKRSATISVSRSANVFVNGYGLVDMVGNVYQWCRDWSSPYEKTSVSDPIGPSVGMCRVVRGGSWSVNNVTCFQSTARDGWFTPGDWINYIGFRLTG